MLKKYMGEYLFLFIFYRLFAQHLAQQTEFARALLYSGCGVARIVG